MFGLAALAAVAAMAFVGASSAMAGTSAICETNEEPCQAANLVTHVHFVDPAAKLLTTPITVTCNALFLGDALGLVSGGPAVVHGSFTYTGCNSTCTATDLKGGLLLVLRTAAGLAEVTGDGFEVAVKCAGLIECEYDGQGLVGHGLSANLADVGGTAGSVIVNNQTVHPTGNKLTNIICPDPAKLDANFVSLEDIFIST